MQDKIYYQQLAEAILREHPFYNNTELAYEVILQEILNGNIGAEERIGQEMFSSVLDMSRTPVRDALQRLERDKFLEKSEKSGYQIQKIKLKDYVDFFEFRLIVERKAAYLAARNITDVQQEQLQQNLQAFEQLLNTRRFHEMWQLDIEFHRIIAEASHNEYIYENLLRYRNKEIFNMKLLVQENSLKYMLKKHRAIYEAICDCDEDKAERMMNSHLQFYLKNIYRLYE